jgi:dsDNA-binding SOS-regulon protein
MNVEKRYPLLIAFLSQNLTDVTDSILDMFDANLDEVLHRCRRSLEIYQQETVN